MIVGVPKEIKISENRVGMTEAGVQELVLKGHTVLVEKDAGVGSLISNEAYEKVGAQIIETKAEVYKKADMIVKVKEPLEPEYELMKENQIIYTYLHLAAEPKLAQVLVDKKVKAVAYETIEDKNGGLPLLMPMSAVAGRMATQIGAYYLQKDHGGKGILLGGVSGVRPGKVTIVGAGIVGTNAAKMAIGLGADVTILDINQNRLEFLDDVFEGRIRTLHSNTKNIEESVLESDLVIGAVLVAGRKAPKLVTRSMVSKMSQGSVVVDVAVDQGGCIETCKPTSHVEPTFEVDGVIHYCVPNMPGVVSRTSTYALTNLTLSYALSIADLGLEAAIQKDPLLKKGVNVYQGNVCYEPVALDLGYDYKDYSSLI